MLFRRIDALPDTLKGEYRDLLPGFQPLMQAVRSAHRLIFAHSAAASCFDLARDKRSLKRARSQIFAPFQDVWMEWANDPDIGALWQGERFNMQRGHLVFITWPRSHVVPLLYQFTGCIDDPFRLPFLPTPQSYEALRKAYPPGTPGPYIGKTPEELGDWMTGPILASFSLLASKGMIASVQADMTKLNRSRAKAGKYPLLGYDEIQLNLDVERVLTDAGRKSVATGTMPLHSVRAHLRLIASGRVVIVRAHNRGNPEYGIRRSHYSVVRDEDLIE